jgi:lipopolysaccharide export system ATP-binding protein
MPELDRAEREARTEELLERFHLESLARQKAGHLSGGEQRRLEIARVLARQPSLILLDEPFANIDPITVEEIQEILSSLRREGMGILLTDHNVRETLTVTDRSYIIVEGRIFRHGPARRLVEDEMVRRTYLGERFAMPELRSGTTAPGTSEIPEGGSTGSGPE